MTYEEHREYARNRIADLVGADTGRLTFPVRSSEGNNRLLSLLESDSEGNLIINYLDLEKTTNGYQLQTYEGHYYDPYQQCEVPGSIPYQVVRLAKPVGDKKYDNPAGTGARLFYTPSVIDAYYMASPIETLYIVEGQIKALVGYMNGLYIIGTNGLTGWKKAGEEEFFDEIHHICKRCHVENLVLIQDGDCRALPTKLDLYSDLATRPNNFMSAVLRFRTAIKKMRLKRLDGYYCHVQDHRELPKGLDDLYLSGLTTPETITQALESRQSSDWFVYRELLDFSRNEAKSYFRLLTPKSFWEAHEERLGDSPFIFQGYKYKYDYQTDEIENLYPAELERYSLVGTKYFYEFPDLRTVKGQSFIEWKRRVIDKETIRDALARAGAGREEVNRLLLLVPKYNDYKNEPDFTNYQRVLTVEAFDQESRFLNLAYPIEFVPQPGDWSNIRGFLTHIFTSGGEDVLDVGLDMIQLYYTQPKQKQRVMALVSKENETGKSTFLVLLRYIFGQNMAIVGNGDLMSEFNGYVTKSLVGVDESKISDRQVVERLKSLITMPTVLFNDKNISAVEIDNHTKLIMTTNHVSDFVQIDEEENKWFVVEVGQVKEKNSDLMGAMIAEIPAFLHYLRNRELVHYTTKSRFAIPDDVVQTQALRRIKDTSGNPIVKMVREFVARTFQEFPDVYPQKLELTTRLLHRGLFEDKPTRVDEQTLQNILKTEMGLKTDTTTRSCRLYIQPVVMEQPQQDGTILFYDTRYKQFLPTEDSAIILKDKGRQYVFTRSDFKDLLASD